MITNRNSQQNHLIQLWFGLRGIPVLHQSYWIVCGMKGFCIVQTYRTTINFIFLLVMQFQSIHFSQDTAVFFLRNFRAVVQSKSLAVLCFSRNGHNKMSPKRIFFKKILFFRIQNIRSKYKNRYDDTISSLTCSHMF